MILIERSLGGAHIYTPTYAGMAACDACVIYRQRRTNGEECICVECYKEVYACAGMFVLTGIFYADEYRTRYGTTITIKDLRREHEEVTA